ncbi:MAG: 50S ribosomal protein L21 [Acidobacteriaceae bacterium]|nr:50S ribosomal protein L21 [Acidobacteriaceae bacterium]
MYAVIRSGGKQYRVAPGDVIRIESQGNGTQGRVEFGDILAVSATDGQIEKAKPDTHVIGEVVEQGRGDKILVFHYKRKKQYKKLRGHRQPFTAVRITEIGFDGQSFKAPELPKKEAKPKKTVSAETDEPKEVKAQAKGATKRASGKKPTAKKAAGKKKKS